VSIIDMGTQQITFEGNVKHQHKVQLTFEILDDETRKDDGSPFTLSKRYTVSLYERADLRKALVSWRGKDFTAAELISFDLTTVLGKDAFLSVIHEEKKGRTYANITAVMRPPKGMTCPEGCGNEPLQHWDMAKPDWAVFATLSPRTVEQIESSPEFKLLKVPTGRIPLKPTAPAPTHTPLDDEYDPDEVAF
jgi:hypothetical protein